jgi:hypothetical protein
MQFVAVLADRERLPVYGQAGSTGRGFDDFYAFRDDFVPNVVPEQNSNSHAPALLVGTAYPLAVPRETNPATAADATVNTRLHGTHAPGFRHVALRHDAATKMKNCQDLPTCC